MSLVNFLNGTAPDHQGRHLRDIWDFDDKAIRQTHDFIQWMFPLTEKSMSVPGVPTLSVEDIEAIRASELTRANLESLAKWYLGFLKRNDHWIRSYDHNHLRITRAIKSLDLLSSPKMSSMFLETDFVISEAKLDLIKQDSINFWLNAAGRANYK